MGNPLRKLCAEWVSPASEIVEESWVGIRVPRNAELRKRMSELDD